MSFHIPNAKLAAKSSYLSKKGQTTNDRLDKYKACIALSITYSSRNGRCEAVDFISTNDTDLIPTLKADLELLGYTVKAKKTSIHVSWSEIRFGKVK